MILLSAFAFLQSENVILNDTSAETECTVLLTRGPNCFVGRLLERRARRVCCACKGVRRYQRLNAAVARTGDDRITGFAGRKRVQFISLILSSFGGRAGPPVHKRGTGDALRLRHRGHPRLASEGILLPISRLRSYASGYDCGETCGLSVVNWTSP